MEIDEIALKPLELSIKLRRSVFLYVFSENILWWLANNVREKNEDKQQKSDWKFSSAAMLDLYYWLGYTTSTLGTPPFIIPRIHTPKLHETPTHWPL